MDHWMTKEGNEILYKDLEYSHLVNILRFIEKQAKKGMILAFGCVGSSASDMYYDEDYLTGKEVLDHYNYDELVKEFKRRNHDTTRRPS